MNRNQTLQF